MFQRHIDHVSVRWHVAGSSKKKKEDTPKDTPLSTQGAEQAWTPQLLLSRNCDILGTKAVPNGYGQYPGPYPGPGGRVHELDG